MRSVRSIPKRIAASADTSGGAIVLWRPLARILLVCAFVLLWAQADFAMPLAAYHERVKKAISSLDFLHEVDESQPAARGGDFASTQLQAAREAVPRRETVEWNASTINVDNSWFADELARFEKLPASDPERIPTLDRILERLQAIAERLEEIDKATSGSPGKSEMNQRLAAILQRTEYIKPVKQQSAIARWFQRINKWIESLFPKQREINPNRVRTVSRLSEIFVILIALAAIAYAVRMFAPHLIRNRNAKKKAKAQARVVLGEQLSPDQSATDLLAEAEALARAGDLRGAIRRGYIALLLELADRKIISLAQYKTNRDYLRSVRDVQRLYPNMKVLTNNFEEHWYGLAAANESDWVAFRAGYHETLRST
jgi:hypothetical protein